jgi:hypothetical protein
MRRKYLGGGEEGCGNNFSFAEIILCRYSLNFNIFQEFMPVGYDPLGPPGDADDDLYYSGFFFLCFF